LEAEVSDVDGNVEKRSGAISVFNGPPPDIHTLATAEQETTFVAAWLKKRLTEGIEPHEIGIVVRSETQIPRAAAALRAAEIPFTTLDDLVAVTSGRVALATMHLAKGLEFRAVAVMACDEDVIPLRERIESLEDEADLEDVYNTERHLLYVACTRARDHLLITGIKPGSEFLGDMRATNY
jgi:superfamily I DNA/RNA helicase